MKNMMPMMVNWMVLLLKYESVYRHGSSLSTLVRSKCSGISGQELGAYQCNPLSRCTRNTAAKAIQKGFAPSMLFSACPGGGGSMSDRYTLANGNGSRSLTAH